MQDTSGFHLICCPYGPFKQSSDCGPAGGKGIGAVYTRVVVSGVGSQTSPDLTTSARSDICISTLTEDLRDHPEVHAHSLRYLIGLGTLQSQVYADQGGSYGP